MTSTSSEEVRRLYRTTLDGIQDRMSQSIRVARQVLHHTGEKGASVERIIRSGLRDILPEKVGVTHGFVIDATGGRSRQMDFILYDRMSAPRFFPLPGIQVLPVEITYAAGEIKTRLDGARLRDCLEKCRSCKVLERTAYIATASPIVTSLRLFGEEHEHWQSIFVCIAVTASNTEGLVQQYDELTQEGALRHDMGIDALLSLETNGKRNMMLNVTGSIEGGEPPNESIDLLPSPRSRVVPLSCKAPWALFSHLLLGYMTLAPSERIDLLRYAGPDSF